MGEVVVHVIPDDAFLPRTEDIPVGHLYIGYWPDGGQMGFRATEETSWQIQYMWHDNNSMYWDMLDRRFDDPDVVFIKGSSLQSLCQTIEMISGGLQINEATFEQHNHQPEEDMNPVLVEGA